jgi:Tol biopolymer transport system component
MMRTILLFVASAVTMTACASATPAPAPAPTDVSVVIARPSVTAPAVAVTSVAQPTATQPAPPATSVPTPTSAPTARFVQLTQGGCCVQPFFDPTGERVLFLDRPGPTQPTGIWGLRVSQPLAPPELFSETPGPYSRDLAYSVSLVNGRTTLQRNADGQRTVIDNGGRSVSFSPDATRVLWTVEEEAGGFDRRRYDLWLANVDGSDARRVITRYGGGALAWFTDGQRLLVGGRPNRTDAAPTLSVFSLADGSTRDLITVERLRGVSLSPDGARLVYFVSQARETGLGGMYLLDLETAAVTRLDFFGAYRWRDGRRLLYIPLELNAPSQSLWQIDVTTGQRTQLVTAEAGSPFRIGNGDWDVARDGSKLVYVNAVDRNIWMVTLDGL